LLAKETISGHELRELIAAHLPDTQPTYDDAEARV
jgi:hypothetical protein